MTTERIMVDSNGSQEGSSQAPDKSVEFKSSKRKKTYSNTNWTNLGDWNYDGYWSKDDDFSITVDVRAVNEKDDPMLDNFNWTLDRDWLYDECWARVFPRRFSVESNESVEFAEDTLKQIDKRCKCNVSFGEQWHNNLSFGLDDSIALKEEHAGRSSFKRNFSSSILFSEEAKFERRLDRDEKVDVSDALCLQAGVVKVEPLPIVESFTTKNSFNLVFAETILVSEKTKRALVKPLCEQITVRDRALKQQSSLLFESLPITSNLIKQIKHELFEESFDVKKDDENNSLNKVLSHRLLISEKRTNKEDLLFSSRFKINEIFGKKHRQSCAIEECLSITDETRYKQKLSLKDDLPIRDGFFQPANGVISDLFFEEGEWTEDEVKKYVFKGKAVGYGFFKPFVFGEYRYSSALFRTCLDANDQEGLYMENFKYSVDVPDVVDRGMAELTDANFNLTVKFNKKFHVAPEVTVTMRSGASGHTVIPNIVETTKTHFVVNLTNTSNGERDIGRFIWTAIGY